MQTETTDQTPLFEALGISEERMASINHNLATAVKEFFYDDKYQSKSDAIKLAIEHCKFESISEAVMAGMALEGCLSNFGDPMTRLLRALSK